MWESPCNLERLSTNDPYPARQSTNSLMNEFPEVRVTSEPDTEPMFARERAELSSTVTRVIIAVQVVGG